MTAVDSGRTLGVALVGYGFAGRTFHAPLIASVEGLELRTVVSRRATDVLHDVPGVRVVDDPAQAFDDPAIDLVVIATPNDTHEPLARTALSAGRHVVIDKPFVLGGAQARALAAHAGAQGRLLSVFQNRRWDTDFLAVQAAITDGSIGRVVHVESRMERFRPVVRPRWREQAGPGAGLWWDLGPHLVDQALLLMGIPETVQADFACQRSGGTTDDWAHVVLGYGARRVVLHAGMLGAGGMPRFVVHGDRGSLGKAHADPQEAQLLAGLRPGSAAWGVDSDPVRIHVGGDDARERAAPRGDQSRYYAAVRDAIRGTGDNPVSPAQACAVIAVLECAIESAREGRRLVPHLLDSERAAFDPARL